MLLGLPEPEKPGRTTPGGSEGGVGSCPWTKLTDNRSPTGTRMNFIILTITSFFWRAKMIYVLHTASPTYLCRGYSVIPRFIYKLDFLIWPGRWPTTALTTWSFGNSKMCQLTVIKLHNSNFAIAIACKYWYCLCQLIYMDVCNFTLT